MKIAIEIEPTNEILHLLPVWALHDINKRITDWLAGGGSLEDNYIKQQLRFAENVLEAMKSRRI